MPGGKGKGSSPYAGIVGAIAQAKLDPTADPHLLSQIEQAVLEVVHAAGQQPGQQPGMGQPPMGGGQPVPTVDGNPPAGVKPGLPGPNPDQMAALLKGG